MEDFTKIFEIHLTLSTAEAGRILLLRLFITLLGSHLRSRPPPR
jgi:hypothetical protein